MTAFRTLRLRARYNILTPIAVLSAGLALTMGAPAMAANITGPVNLGSGAVFVNNDQISTLSLSAVIGPANHLLDQYGSRLDQEHQRLCRRSG